MGTAFILAVLACIATSVVGQDPWYSCPHKLTAKQCPWGLYHCYCPGDKKEVTYDIECDKVRLMTCKIPKDVNLNCNRYARCATCKSHVGRTDNDVCLSCGDIGYQGMQCDVDIDECATGNGNCKQICENNPGSYDCRCNHGYFLMPDEHDCDRLSCGRPDDKEGLNLRSVLIPGARDWEYETSVEYSCSRLNHVIFGHSQRQCDLTSDKKYVEWHGVIPHCVVECNPKEDHAQCGVMGVDPVVCDQLGCCYLDQLGTCHMRPGNHYVEYDNVKPNPTNPVSPVQSQNASYCKDLCEKMGTCRSFAVEQLAASLYCYLYPEERQHYINAGQIKSDLNSIYYDPLKFKDDLDWKGERAAVQNQLDYGCFDKKMVDEYLPLVALTEQKLLTTLQCSDVCRTLGYRYSAVRIDECRCGKDVPSEIDLLEDGYDENISWNDTLNMVCQINCTGDAGQFCGGETRYTVQVVPQDNRYLGCFDDNIYHMPIRRWGADEEKTVDDCIKECSRIKLSYAAIHNGGDCFCGPVYPIGAGVPHQLCNATCAADKNYMACGSAKYNSVYKAPTVADLGENEVSHFASTLYFDDTSMTTTDTMLFTLLPKMRHYITRKMVVSASVPFLAPQEDQFCSSGECYAPCGSLNLGNQVITDQDYVVIRQFIVRYSEVKELLKNKKPKQVNIYAEAVYIDVNIVVDYALLIRARHVYVDREVATYFHSTEDAPVLNVENEDEWARILHEGPYPDLLFQRLAFTCMRILIGTSEQKFINVGFAIVNDLIAAPSKDSEQKAMVRMAASVKAKFSGIDFSNTHPVPLYNKNHLVNILETYYDQITIYKHDYDRIQDSALLYADFLNIAQQMNEIHESTGVNEALVCLKNVEEQFEQDTEIQGEIEEQYDKASEELDIAKDKLIEEIEAEYENEKKKSRLAFLTAIAGVVKGLVTKSFADTAKSFAQTFGHASAMESTFQQLAELVAQINLIVQESKAIMAGDKELIKEKEGEVVVDLENMVAMSVNIHKWEAMMELSDITIEGMGQSSARSFRVAMSQYCIWGKAFSEAMVERAETMRSLLEKQAIYDLRKLQAERSQQVLQDAELSVDKRLEVMHVMQEQMLDVCLDMNEVLLQFCQAYFFENLKECREEYRPSFGGSMSKLLLKVNAAKRDSLYSADVPSTVSRSIGIANSNSSSTCADPEFCPITSLDKSRFLVLTIAWNNTAFKHIQKYRVKEIFMEFQGLDHTQPIRMMKFILRNTGLFHDVRGEVFNFLTRPIYLTFEQELSNTGHVTIHADLPDDVHQITPFTTWIIQAIDEEGRLDLSGVNEVKIRFDGTGIPAM